MLLPVIVLNWTSPLSAFSVSTSILLSSRYVTILIKQHWEISVKTATLHISSLSLDEVCVVNLKEEIHVAECCGIRMDVFTYLSSHL